MRGCSRTHPLHGEQRVGKCVVSDWGKPVYLQMSGAGRPGDSSGEKRLHSCPDKPVKEVVLITFLGVS